MTDLQLDMEHFRRRLLELCKELEHSSLAATESAAPVELDQQRQGRLSRMDALGAQAVSAAAQRRRRQRLQLARAALRRIDAGDYGLCMDCDEPIDPRRLEFDPTVETCINCAQQRET